jgi:hypothetical protein
MKRRSMSALRRTRSALLVFPLSQRVERAAALAVAMKAAWISPVLARPSLSGWHCHWQWQATVNVAESTRARRPATDQAS